MCDCLRRWEKRWVWALAFLAFVALPDRAAAAQPFPRESYAQIRALLGQLASKWPGNAKLFVLGQSDSGLPIEGLQIGSGPVKNLVVATHHGNEYGATEVAKAFAASMAEHPIPGQSVYIVPVLNVSGFDRRDRWERGSAGQSFDPNRDYPGPCGTEGPFRLKSTAALARFVEAEGIVTAATLHTKHPAVVYPWGFGAADLSTHYDGLFRSLAEAATVESGYRTGNSTELIYAADGTFEDYAFWQHGIWAMLFEIGSTHSPSAEQVAEQNRVNVSGLRRMLEQAPRERAERHAFESQCQYSVFNVDLHDE